MKASTRLFLRLVFALIAHHIISTLCKKEKFVSTSLRLDFESFEHSHLSMIVFFCKFDCMMWMPIGEWMKRNKIKEINIYYRRHNIGVYRTNTHSCMHLCDDCIITCGIIFSPCVISFRCKCLWIFLVFWRISHISIFYNSNFVRISISSILFQSLYCSIRIFITNQIISGSAGSHYNAV